MHGQNPRTRRDRLLRPSLAASLALGLGVLGGCSDTTVDAPDTFDYVALGDSFTAAGLPPASGTCRRSGQNYPHLLVSENPSFVLVDVSCGGASTTNMLQTQDVEGDVQPPQLDAISDDTDLVTVGLGGNDFDVISKFLFQCIDVAGEDRDGDPCRTRNDGLVERRMGRIRDNLAAVLEEIGDRAPEARVLMVGYPRLVPEDGECPRQVPLASGDVDYVRDMMALLVEAQEGAAEDAGVDYVDVYGPSEGHDMCSEDPWVNDVTDGPKGAYPFHPMPAHQRAVTDLIMEML
ncbi:MAG TPA: SGNH/GDSL hydrolase family protein [Nocardioides sp.]|nr:SGNH/GDSL hydrolase family protein [Nocardioides sp.]